MRKAVICSQSNFTTDYRIEKMRQTLVSLGYDVTLLGRSHPHEDRTNAWHPLYAPPLLAWGTILR